MDLRWFRARWSCPTHTFKWTQVKTWSAGDHLLCCSRRFPFRPQRAISSGSSAHILPARQDYSCESSNSHVNVARPGGSAEMTMIGMFFTMKRCLWKWTTCSAVKSVSAMLRDNIQGNTAVIGCLFIDCQPNCQERIWFVSISKWFTHVCTQSPLLYLHCCCIIHFPWMTSQSINLFPSSVTVGLGFHLTFLYFGKLAPLKAFPVCNALFCAATQTKLLEVKLLGDLRTSVPSGVPAESREGCIKSVCSHLTVSNDSKNKLLLRETGAMGHWETITSSTASQHLLPLQTALRSVHQLPQLRLAAYTGPIHNKHYSGHLYIFNQCTSRPVVFLQLLWHLKSI